MAVEAKSEFKVGGFGNSPEDYGFPGNEILKIDTQTIVMISKQFYNNTASYR